MAAARTAATLPTRSSQGFLRTRAVAADAAKTVRGGTPKAEGDIRAVPEKRCSEAEIVIHDVQPDLAERRMGECVGNGADDSEAQTLIERDSRGV